ncbi:MAG: DUF4332 domain-containing protein [Candidatus Sericytochromatia bacterium]|nr:DUF4332 domain-containing protein [Candidatus Sericytochromatia bacterium]
MRHTALSLITLTTLLVAGCGTQTGTPTPRLGGVSQAASLTDEGSLVFDKDVVYKALDVLGVGPVFGGKLKAAGVDTVKELLLAGTTPTARRKLAESTGLSPKNLLTWINHADLMRVTGCGPEYSRLLERAGVDTVMELARRNSIQLAARLKAANDLGGGRKCVQRLPNVTTTTRWVDNANSFARLVSY